MCRDEVEIDFKRFQATFIDVFISSKKENFSPISSKEKEIFPELAVDKIFFFFFFFFSTEIEILFLSNSIPWNRWTLFKLFPTANISCRGKYLNVDSTRYSTRCTVCSSNRFELYADSYSSIHYKSRTIHGSKYLRIISREYISCWAMQLKLRIFMRITIFFFRFWNRLWIFFFFFWLFDKEVEGFITR